MINNNIQYHDLNPFWNIKSSFIFLLLTIFSLTSILAIYGITNNLDNILFGLFNSFKSQSTDMVMIVMTTASDTINLIIMGFILAIIKRTRRFGMILLISLVCITIIVTYIKPLFGVDEPIPEFKPLVTLPDKFTLEQDSFMPFAQNYSYPSNHIASTAAFSFIIGGLMYNYSHKFAKTFVISFPIIIAITKLYLFQHHLMDLIGGYFLGMVLVSIIIKALKANLDVKNDHIAPKP